jgi:hypothetical protein
MQSAVSAKLIALPVGRRYQPASRKTGWPIDTLSCTALFSMEGGLGLECKEILLREQVAWVLETVPENLTLHFA